MIENWKKFNLIINEKYYKISKFLEFVYLLVFYKKS